MNQTSFFGNSDKVGSSLFANQNEEKKEEKGLFSGKTDNQKPLFSNTNESAKGLFNNESEKKESSLFGNTDKPKPLFDNTAEEKKPSLFGNSSLFGNN